MEWIRLGQGAPPEAALEGRKDVPTPLPQQAPTEDEWRDPMTLKQLWSILRGRRTDFRWANASWTYYPDGDPMGKPQAKSADTDPALKNGERRAD